MFTPEVPTAMDRMRFMLTTRISRLMNLVGQKQRQLVVCGYPRSGTSLLYNMLASTLRGKFRFTEFEKYFIHHIHKLGNIATKAPLDILHIKYIDSLNIHKKNLIILVMVRDIREVITSRHPVFPDKYFIGGDFSYWPQDSEFNEWKYDAPGVIQISEAIRVASKRNDVLIVKYEDLTSNPDKVQKKLGCIYDLEFDGEFSKYNEYSSNLPYSYSGKYKPKDPTLVLEGGSVIERNKRWMDPKYKGRIVDQFEKCPELFDLLIEYGYEEDISWFTSIRKM